MSDKKPSANLPSEIGAVIEQLAVKAAKADGAWIADYAEFEDTVISSIKVSRQHIKDEDMAGLVSKPVGRYSTLQTGPLNEYGQLENICSCLSEELRRYLAPYMGKPLLICGIGNPDLPYDALGPETARRIYPKITMEPYFEKMSVFTPSVSSSTNISTIAAVSGMVTAVNAACVLAIDATDCSDPEDICSCVQLTDAGLHINKSGEILDAGTIGVPVIAVGVPTSIHASRLGIKVPCDDLLIPAGITGITKYAASAIACAVLQVAYADMDYETSKMFVDQLLLY